MFFHKYPQRTTIGHSVLTSLPKEAQQYSIPFENKKVLGHYSEGVTQLILFKKQDKQRRLRLKLNSIQAISD